MQPQATQTPPATEPKPAPPATETAPASSLASPPANDPVSPAKTGYGKRPVWQWVLIYVVLAVIVYGLVYYFFLRDSGSTSGY